MLTKNILNKNFSCAEIRRRRLQYFDKHHNNKFLQSKFIMYQFTSVKNEEKIGNFWAQELLRENVH